MNANLLLFKTVVALDSWGLVAIPLIEYNPIAAVIFCGCSAEWVKRGEDTVDFSDWIHHHRKDIYIYRYNIL